VKAYLREYKLLRENSVKRLAIAFSNSDLKNLDAAALL
jgi:hypothetical protein